MELDVQHRLFEAAENGQEHIIQEILEDRNLGPDQYNQDGNALLHFAAANGRENVVECLIQRSANVDCASPYLWTPLMQACAYGHIPVVNKLLESNCDVNKKNALGANAILCAARGGHTSVVQSLLTRNASIENENEELTPLMAAASAGHESVCRLLIDNEANVDTSIRGTGWTALMHAAHNGYLSVVQVLVKSKSCSPNKTNCLDMTALDVAMAAKHSDIETFLSNKTDTMRSASLRQSLEKVDILEATIRGNYDRVKALLAADPTACNTTNSDGATCLMFAAMRGHLAIAELLVDHNVRLNDQDKVAGWTALMQATYYANVSVMRLLLDAGADVSIRAFDGYTAFEHASLIGETDAVRLLASLGLHKQPVGATRVPRKASRSSSGGGVRPRVLTDKDFLGKTFESLMASQSRMFSELSSDGSLTDSGLGTRPRRRRRRRQRKCRQQQSTSSESASSGTNASGSPLSWLAMFFARVRRALSRKAASAPISQGQTTDTGTPPHNHRTPKKPRFASNKVAPMSVEAPGLDTDSNDSDDMSVDGAMHEHGLREKRAEMQRAGQRQREGASRQHPAPVRHQQPSPHRRHGGAPAGQLRAHIAARADVTTSKVNNAASHGNAPSPLRHSAGGTAALGSTVRGAKGAGLVGMNFIGAPVSKFPADLLAPIKPPFMPPPAFELALIERPKFERPVHRTPAEFGGGGAAPPKGHALSRKRASFLRPQNERTALGALPRKPLPRVPSNGSVGVGGMAQSPGSTRKHGNKPGQKSKKSGPRVTFQLGPARTDSVTPDPVSSNFSLSAKDSPIAARKTTSGLDSDSGPAIELQNVLREHGLLHIYSVLAKEEIDIDAFLTLSVDDMEEIGIADAKSRAQAAVLIRTLVTSPSPNTHERPEQQSSGSTTKTADSARGHPSPVAGGTRPRPPNALPTVRQD
eukprot:m.992744 g.992744  ORF g.992744 m.992744 type:complete len:929 (-) comp24007_c0_seq6:6-2792(-)